MSFENSQTNLSKEEELKLRKKFDERYAKDDKEKIDALFDKIQKQQDDDNKKEVEVNQKAINAFDKIFSPKTFVVYIEDIAFTFKHNLSIFEYERFRNIDNNDTKNKLKFLHSLLLDPVITYEQFIQLPAEHITYAERKIYDFFLLNLTNIKSS